MPFKSELDLVVMMVAIALAIAAVTMRAAGQPQKHAAAEEQLQQLLVLQAARVSANEGALQNLPEVSLIWQVVEGSARTAGKRLEFLEKHSPRAMGLVPCGGIGNCEWSRQLDYEGELPPALAAAGVDALWWHLTRRDRWLAVLAATDALARGKVVAVPCGRRPVSWGNPNSVHDSAYASRHGLCRLHCGLPSGGLLNDGYAPC